MGSVQGKVSYLQGLAKGLNFNSQSVEGKMLLNMVDVMDSVAKEMENMHLAQKDMEEYIDSIDEDLEQLEKTVYEDTDSGLVRVECPNCNAEIVFEPADLTDSSTMEASCPTCGNRVYENVRNGIYQTEEARYAGHPGI